MDDIVVNIIGWALTGVLSVTCVALWRNIQLVQRQFDALKAGEQIQLRDRLIHLHDKWCARRGYMPVDVKDLWMKMYEAYEALGENGVITGLYEDVRVAHVKPDDDDADDIDDWTVNPD